MVVCIVTSVESSVVAHVIQIRNQLQEMVDLVHESGAISQADQKWWYDRNEQVLVLLPTSTSKPLAQ